MTTSARGALDAIASRIKTHTPTYRPNEVYRHITKALPDTPMDRMFQVQPQKVAWGVVPGASLTTLDVQVVVVYRERTEVWDLARKCADDCEDLYNRLCYSPGNEWSTDYDVEVTNAVVNEGEYGGATIELSLRVSYNVR